MSEADRDASTILIVEDEELNNKLFEDILSFAGFRTRSAATAECAYAMACEEPPDLVITDLSLPAASGFELIEWMRAEPRLHATPVVAISALHDNYYGVGKAVAGCEAYLVKPVSIHTLIATVKSLIQPAGTAG